MIQVQTNQFSLNTFPPYFVLFLALILTIGCTADSPSASADAEIQAPADALFQKVSSDQTNIHFQTVVQEDFYNNIVRNPNLYNGGGVGVIDVNNDGLQDLFFSSTTGTCRLYLNEGNFKFKDITAMAGIASPDGFKTGVAIADVNGDGWQDIYLCRGGLNPGPDQRNLLYINNWNNTFSESAADYGVADPSSSNCANFFDFDLDGDLDLYVVNYPTDFKLSHQVDLIEKPDGSITRNLLPKTEFDSDRLYRNNGNGTFTDITKQAGLLNRAFGLSTIAMDWNGDHWPDLLVANDYIEPDHLYINNRNGTFTDQAEKSFRHMTNHTMGTDVTDINRDGLPDLIALDMLAEDYQRQKTLSTIMKEERYRTLTNHGYGHQVMRNVLQLNNGPAGTQTVQTPTFSEIGCLAGIFQTDWSWSVLSQDFDQDGWPDIFITNGYRRDVTDLDYVQFTDDSIQRKYGGISSAHFKTIYDYLNLIPSVPLRNYMYQNNGDLTFANKTIEWGLTDKTFSNGAAYADLDNDGDLDLIVNNIESEALIYRNTAADRKKGAWLQLHIQGPAGNPTGVGTIARVTAGGQTWQQELTPVRGFFSCNEPVLHFGLGNAGSIEKIEVLLPPGKKLITLENQPVNQRLVLKDADGKPGTLPPLVVYQPNFFTEVSGAKGLSYAHQEDAYFDFDHERLLPWRLSTPGPALAAGDVNNDGLDDFYIGGAAQSAGALFIQQANGQFSRSSPVVWNADAQYEDAGAIFFDADGDGDIDLLVASGGNSSPAGSDRYQPRLYLNDGKGQFVRADEALPRITDSAATIAVFDYDNDGDPDVFLGGYCVPGAYPQTPASHVLQNNKGIFTDVTHTVAPEFAACGMVRSVIFADLDQDKSSEMIVAGEWMPIMIFKLKNGKFENATAGFGLNDSNGFWRSLAAADIDGDGDIDLVAGNLGFNTRMTASQDAPLHIYAKDFDGNGSIDPLMSYTHNGTEYPLALREKLLKQIPSLKKKFVRNQPYAYATLEDVYPRNELNTALRLSANTLANSYFENRNGKFIRHALPNAAQVAPAQSILIEDFNRDGKPDVLLVGNDYGQQIETARINAGNGLILINNGAGTFNPVPPCLSGLWATLDARVARLLRLAGDKRLLLVGNNNDRLQAFELN